MVLCIALAAPGWLRLQASDSLSQLATLAPERLQAERTLQTLTGLNPSGQFLLVQAPSPEQVLVLEEQLAPRLEKLQREGAMQSHQRLSAFVPSFATQQLNTTTWATRLWLPEHTLDKVLDDAGLHPQVARQLHADWRRIQNQPLQLDDWLAQPWAEPLRPLWLGATPHGYASVILPMGLADKGALRTAVQGIPGIQMVDKPGNIEALLGEARRSAAQWLVAAVAVLWGLLALRYRPRRAALLMLPALLGAGLALGTFGWLAMPVTLPTLMALMLVLGVGVNYPVFLWEGSFHSAAALLGVLISASTTLLSFGLLVFSSMPALQQFGLTLLIGTLTTMALTPLGTRRLGRKEST